MHLILKNFRKWSELKLELPNDSLILLSGNSSAGKSSILDAIIFAITGKVKNVLRKGTKKGHVILEINGLKIQREKGPANLLVYTQKETLKNDVAQAYLDKRFGDDMYLTTYMSQKTDTTFVRMSPAEKSVFLEKRAIGGEEITLFKQKIKEELKVKKKEYLVSKSQYDVLVSQGDREIEEPELMGEKIDIPLEELKKSLQREKERYEKNRKEITISEDLKRELDTLERSNVIDVDVLNSNISYKEEYQEYVESKNTYKDLVSRYKEYEGVEEKLREVESLIAKKAEIQRELEEIKDSKRQLEYMEETQKLREEIRDLQSLQDSLDNKKEIYNEIKSRLDVHECPHCGGGLKIYKDKIEKQEGKGAVSKTEKMLLKSLKTEIDELNSNITRLKEIEVEIKLRVTSKDKANIKVVSQKYQQELQDRYKEILKAEQGLIVLKMGAEKRNDIRKMIKKLKGNLVKPTSPEEIIESTLEELSEMKRQYINTRQRISEINTRLKQISTFTDNSSVISTLETQIENASLYNRYLLLKSQYDQYINRCEKIKTLKRECESISHTIALLERLWDNVVKTENETIAATIDTININVAYYIQKFFEGEEINVQIKPYKKTKKGEKSSINLEIIYEGVEFDFKDMSGGQKDRIELAFILAFNEGMELLILDECISSLQGQLCDEILGYIKEESETGNGKTVLVVSHQIKTGAFDHVYDVCDKRVTKVN